MASDEFRGKILGMKPSEEAAKRLLDRGELIREVEKDYPELRDTIFLGFIIQAVLGKVVTPLS